MERLAPLVDLPAETLVKYLAGTVGVALFGSAVAFALIPSPPKIGVYSQPNKWYYLKYWTFFLLLKVRQWQNSRSAKGERGDAGFGKRSRNSVEDMDKIQELPKEHPKAVDAVYFNGASKDGCYFVGATARRHDNLIQTLLYIRFPDFGLLELPSLPDTCLLGEKPLSYAAGGLHIEVVEPMKRWRLSFKGLMRLIRCDGSRQEVPVSFRLDWLAYTPHFDFDTDLHQSILCDAIAREVWSRERFEDLKLAHQTHYEQFGEISGSVDIGGYGERRLQVQGVRDHSYGNLRDWGDLHRYAIQYLHLDDGKAICIGSICMPRTMTRLIIGYVFHPNGQLERVKSCDINLHELGEDGNDPTNFVINFTAGNTKYHLEGLVLDRPIFYMGWDWESRIHERMCTYKVNNVPGWGISEWCYRNHTGRPNTFKPKPDEPDA